MSTDQTITEVELTNLERRLNKTDEYLAALNVKIDILTALLNSHFIEVAKKPQCPSPGQCVALSYELKTVIASHEKTMQKVLNLETRILAVEKWQARMIGGIALLMVFLTLFGPNIRSMFNL